MKVNIWFDFNNDSLTLIKNFFYAFNSFQNRNLVRVAFRSVPSGDIYKHQVYQSLKKEDKPLDVIIDIFNDNFDHNNPKLQEGLLSGKLEKIVKAHLDQSALHKITKTPTITFSHGFRIDVVGTPDVIKNKLILMYEKETGIEYCEEDDCIR